MSEILERARREARTTNAVADQMAQECISGNARKMVA